MPSRIERGAPDSRTAWRTSCSTKIAAGDFVAAQQGALELKKYEGTRAQEGGRAPKPLNALAEA